MYRPEDWENPFDPTTDWRKSKYGIRYRDFEAGADAILEGLKKDPRVLLHIYHDGDEEFAKMVEDYYRE